MKFYKQIPFMLVGLMGGIIIVFCLYQWNELTSTLNILDMHGSALDAKDVEMLSNESKSGCPDIKDHGHHILRGV